MKQKNLVLMMVAVGCGLVAAFLTTQINAKPKVETVEVLVAKKNLPVGTVFTKTEIPNLIERKKVPKDALPPQFVVSEEDLFEKRLSRSTQKEEVINPGFLTKGGVVTLPDGKDMVSLSMSAVDAAGGFVGPGSKVDVLARLNVGNSLRVFPLLIDMHVLTVNTHTSYESKNGGAFPDVSMVSLAVTQEEALLLELAKQRGCHMSLLLRHEGKSIDPNYDMKKIRQLLESVTTPQKFVTFEGGKTGEGTSDREGGPTVSSTKGTMVEPAPAPAFKAEMAKVWVAKEDLAPGTDLTADLIKDKFTEKEYPKEYVEGAYTDLTPLLGKSFKFGIAKGQWVTDALVGIYLKPSDHDFDINGLPKPGPVDPAQAAVKVVLEPKKVVKPTMDVAVHTTSGTVVHRYQEVRPGEWKLIAVMTPEQAAHAPAGKESTAAPAPAPANESPAQPNTKKPE
jgi:Flp pilus assembly protein CpaB